MSGETPTNPPRSADPRLVLADAAATAAPCALRWAMKADGAIDRAARTRSLALSDDGFEVAVAAADGPALAAMASGGGKVLATIRRHNVDMLFVSRVLSAAPRGQAEFAAILAVPTRMLAAARRGLFRVDLGEADLASIGAAAWKIEPGVPIRDRVRPSQALTCRLHDLSGGGGRMTLAPRHGSAPIVIGQRIKIELTLGERTLRFDGCVRDAVETAHGWRCGVQFVEHAHDVEMKRDTEALHHLLADLQRQAARRRAA